MHFVAACSLQSCYTPPCAKQLQCGEWILTGQLLVQILAAQSPELAASDEVHGGTLQLLEVVKAQTNALDAPAGQVSPALHMPCSSPCNMFLKHVSAQSIKGFQMTR